MTARMRLVSFALAAVISGVGVRTAGDHAPVEPPLSWGDQNDGTYRNPILPADFSDPDAIRVGDDFYMGPRRLARVR